MEDYEETRTLCDPVTGEEIEVNVSDNIKTRLVELASNIDKSSLITTMNTMRYMIGELNIMLSRTSTDLTNYNRFRKSDDILKGFDIEQEQSYLLEMYTESGKEVTDEIKTRVLFEAMENAKETIEGYYKFAWSLT